MHQEEESVSRVGGGVAELEVEEVEVVAAAMGNSNSQPTPTAMGMRVANRPMLTLTMRIRRALKDVHAEEAEEEEVVETRAEEVAPGVEMILLRMT